MPQAPGMWLTVELPQPASVTELQFESAAAATGSRQGEEAEPALSTAPPVVGYPRGYSVQVSTDGKTWSKPVAVGKGERPRTTIAFAPTQREVRAHHADGHDGRRARVVGP